MKNIVIFTRDEKGNVSWANSPWQEDVQESESKVLQQLAESIETITNQIIDNELVIATALNDLNSRVTTLEGKINSQGE